MQGCYSLMLGCEQSLPLPFDAALVNDSDIHWISANNSKPNRSSACSLVIQTTNDWADAHLNDNKTDIINSLIAKTSQILNIDLSCMPHFDLHRWRYATGKAKTGAQFFIDQDQKVAACGDWCIDGQVESAFQSATALSEQLLASVV